MKEALTYTKKNKIVNVNVNPKEKMNSPHYVQCIQSAEGQTIQMQL